MPERRLDFSRGPIVARLLERTLYTYLPDRLWENKTLEDLLTEFPRLTVETLTDEGDEHTCGICWGQYQTVYANETEGPVEDKGEQPVKAPCGHVFGHNCLHRWIPYNSCPVCRRPLLDGFFARSGAFVVTQEDAGLIRDIAIADRLMIGMGLQDTHLSTLDHVAEEGCGGRINIYGMVRSRNSNVAPPIIDPTGNSDTSSQTTEEDNTTAPALNRQPAPQTLGVTENPSLSARPAAISVEQDIAHSHAWLRAEIRRVGARRDYILYQSLQARGVNLPPPRTFGAALGENLDWVQDRALFEYIQAQGGFDYPGMHDVYRSARAFPGLPLSDEEIYQTMRDLGMRWHQHGVWESASGTIVFANSALDNGHQVANLWEEVLEARSRGHSDHDEVERPNLALDGDDEAERPNLGGRGGDADGETQGNANDAEGQERRGGGRRLRGVFRGLGLFRRNRDRLRGAQGQLQGGAPPSGRVGRRAREMQEEFNVIARDNGTWATDYGLED